jgi:alpha-L-rhamnosidase
MSLFWEVVPEDMIGKVAEKLAQRVKSDNTHIDVGVLGSKSILNALSENNQDELAFLMASQQTYPSWGYWVTKHNATTLYESWAVKEGEEVSLNHILFGEIGAWFYKVLGGIKPDEKEPGFKKIHLQPHFIKGIQAVSASFQSPYGTIISKWHRKKNKLIYTVTVPANATAQLHLSDNLELRSVRLAGTGKNIIEDLHRNGYHLVAGNYVFEFK